MNTVNKLSNIADHNHFVRANIKNINSQSGWTFWSLLFTMSVIVLFAYIIVQLVPVYSANENVKNAMEQSLENENLLTISRTAIVKNMNAQLYLDGSHDLIDYKEDLKLQRSRSAFTIQTVYEREVPLFFNLSLVAKFDNVIERDLTESSR